jgi:hypothetical protein
MFFFILRNCKKTYFSLQKIKKLNFCFREGLLLFYAIPLAKSTLIKETLKQNVKLLQLSLNTYVGATTFSIITLSIHPYYVFSVPILSIAFFNVMPSVIVLFVVMLNIARLSVFLLSVMQSVCHLSLA